MLSLVSAQIERVKHKSMAKNGEFILYSTMRVGSIVSRIGHITIHNSHICVLELINSSFCWIKQYLSILCKLTASLKARANDEHSAIIVFVEEIAKMGQD